MNVDVLILDVVFCLQALPYVALLIALIFFIYAVVGMQVIIINNILLYNILCIIYILHLLIQQHTAP